MVYHRRPVCEIFLNVLGEPRRSWMIGRSPVLSSYAPLALFAFLMLATGVGMLIISSLLGPRRAGIGKLDPYECGVPLLQGARERFSVRFYLVAILFILFDLETVFLVPWAVVYRKMGMAALLEMIFFLGVLGVALLYVWKRGGLEWSQD